MAKATEKQLGVFGWGVIASVLLHIVVVAGFLIKLPQPTPPPQEETVNVEMVPPPEEKKPEEKKPEEQAALKVPEEPKPEEKKPEQPAAAEKPADEQKPEEKKAEQKPPEPKQEEAKAEPPPPPPKPPEEKAPEAPKPPEENPPQPPPPEKPPEEKPPEEKKAEEPPKPDPAEQAKADQQPKGPDGKPQPIQPLRPVFEFGDNASGPRKAEDGDASTETGKPAGAPDAEKPTDDPASAGKPNADDKPPAKPMPDDINLPQVDVADAHQENNGPAAEATGVVTTEITQAKPKEVAKADPAASAAPAADPMTKVKKLYSQNDTGGDVARTAIDGMPRGMRVAELCTTELREQLRHSPQRFRPELLPSYRLQQGNVLEIKRGAFRASARWYDMSFRCEVDTDGTKVLSFAYDVGAAIPKSQWRSRGFPEF
ncbi:DUF930 domain-containing protein [Rhizobium sp. 16-488-2b]|uniref:DUF930 domain-containing protein n=1 Tax=Rhizobium sp. 16-488-2b TaxID=2819991 RepID=UPI001ADB03E3|nr:DUF930 domain-containing protein [Rhizobium sp. 16-488-2b]MBO9124912.1 DUF930 domain-containing protein [Rhizobium sp. 16-488-2b]